MRIYTLSALRPLLLILLASLSSIIQAASPSTPLSSNDPCSSLVYGRVVTAIEARKHVLNPLKYLTKPRRLKSMPSKDILNYTPISTS
ncbi:hypothetical protein BC829DRAFT_288369 [Chytridium lagenaria]|nr:hypothetical protein BC829DRAFT_288369 [Chytridium lagenaria]